MSKASDDFPDPLTPVTTVNEARGKETSMFLRLFCRAPKRRTIGTPALAERSGTARFSQRRDPLSNGDADRVPRAHHDVSGRKTHDEDENGEADPHDK